MSTGTGAYRRENLSAIWSGDLQDRDDVTTEVEVLLPYGIPGCFGAYVLVLNDQQWELQLKGFYPDPSALEAQLFNCQFEIDDERLVSGVTIGSSTTRAPKRKRIYLRPDRWGRSWRTLATVRTTSLCVPTSQEDLESFEQAILATVCVVLNRFLDEILRLFGRADFPLLTPSDFWAMTVRYVDRTGAELALLESYGRQELWWGEESALDEANKEELRAALEHEMALPEHLLVDSQRKLIIGDARGAIVDSVCAVEASVTQWLRSRIHTRGLSNTQTKEVLRLGVAVKATVLVPAILAPSALAVDTVARFRKANKKRNDIIHVGDRASLAEAIEHTQACETFIAELAGFDDHRAATEG